MRLRNYDDEYVVKVADGLGEAMKLREAEFEYVTNHEGTKIFGKRK